MAHYVYLVRGCPSRHRDSNWYVHLGLSRFLLAMMLCDIDGSILSNSKSVYNHNKLHLNDDHHCEICSKTFSTLEFLKKHKKRTHTDAVYQCNECNEQFKVKYNLKRQIVNIYLNIENTYI